MTSRESPAASLSPGRRRALRAARAKVLQRLFADEYETFSQEDPVLRALIRWEGEDAMANAFADRLYAEILFRREEIDRRIEELARGWSLGRLTRIDRNILRVGLCEILFDPGIPFRVSVDEALDLAHQFSEPEAVAFINGILHEAAVRYAPDKGPFAPAPSAAAGTSGRTGGVAPASGREGGS
ncbi:MAG: transcription antitermination factor NusB [Nitrospirae bacterium]|nr:transcription antitermination factor NusB [Nitrospirota bacterium]